MLRQIRQSPGFFIVAKLLLSLGIAATTLIFTLVDALLLKPLPVRDPQDLVQLFELQQKRPAEPYFDYRFYKQLVAGSSTLFDIAGEAEVTRSLERHDTAERVHVVAVTENFFTDLGISPALGRLLRSGDDHLAVLSNSLWSNTFERDPNVIGQVVRLQGHPFTVIGVAPENFTGTTLDSSPDLWMPLANQLDFATRQNPTLDNYFVEIIARLKPGISQAQAQSETGALWNRYLQETATADDLRSLKRGRFSLQSIAHGVSPLRGQAKNALTLLQSGTGLLLLMVCANVGGLFLARATKRERDTAIRIALGASRRRIFRQWVSESLVVSGTAGAAGLFLSWPGVPFLMRWLPPAHGIGFDPAENRALALRPHLDLRIAAFTVGLCLLTALLCALAPGWRSSQRDIHETLTSSREGRRNNFFQTVLCGFQVALCTMLLVSAGLILHSLRNLRSANTGFDREHISLFSIDPHVRGYDKQKTWLLEQQILNSVKSVPGVEGAALAYRGLMHGIGLGTSVVFPGETGTGVINTSTNDVSPDYFDVMRIPLLEGRQFHASDTADDTKTENVIVNETFVRTFLNGKNPLGAQFDTGQRFTKPRYNVIGVAGNTKYRSLRELPPPIVYMPGFGPNSYPDTFILHVRSSGDPHAVLQPVRELLRSIDPTLPIYQVGTLSEDIDRSLWQERLLVVLTSCFGVFALALSGIGLYGILAYFVARREREIGVRMALGAGARRVVKLVVGQVAPTLLAGGFAGVLFAWLARKWVETVLYEVQPFDGFTTLGVVLLLVVMGLAGTVGPIWRALRLDPASVLRAE
jgi:predicted permease